MPIRTCEGPMQLAMAPSGDSPWIACFFGGVDEVSTATGRVIAHYDVPGSPGNFSFADAGLAHDLQYEAALSRMSSVT
jgi:hypothetical protein